MIYTVLQTCILSGMVNCVAAFTDVDVAHKWATDAFKTYDGYRFHVESVQLNNLSLTQS